ncbi:hypothetical protein GUJ93_ZPchr0269g2882 [Zizania palustris]|uniref:Cellulose synthase n=1 Tax=Zizania palustris TaxID=103762 RepID=A0A8J5UUC7_ZIZPA|nr:hypothetical protein GUJ93_ZPchr0269g2882 [Zizania palustris]
MEASAGLVAGSHNRNELVVIRREGGGLGGEAARRRAEARAACQICGDDVGDGPDGEAFVACNECAFPVCRSCYDYERREGSQACPQCKTRFKRLKGCPRVAGDEEEDGVDDLEGEFGLHGDGREDDPQYVAESMLRASMTYGRGGDPQPFQPIPNVPLLTNGQMVDDIPPEQHALVPSYMGSSGGGKRIHPLPFADPSIPVQPRSMDPSKDLAAYGYGSVAWKERMEGWKQKQERLQQIRSEGGGDWDGDGDPDLPLMDEARQPLSRKVPIPSSRINPYRMIIIIRLVVLGFFFHYRVMHPVNDAFALWLISVICEIWFAMSWILDQFPKWLPIERETYLDRLSLRFDKEGQPSQLAPVDFFVSTVDPLKEPPLVTANTVLSILSVDYPVDKVSCYVSDDGAAMLTFEALSETSEFAKKWVPFCKKFNIEPRAPEWYFQQKIDYLKDKVAASFVRERRAMKRDYEEFKIRINALVAKAQKVPEEGWTMQDGSPWPGNNVRDHPGMIQVFLGQSGGRDVEGNELPRLVYVSREKRPGYNHHKKAGAMNALVRVSAVLTNAPYLLNLDCDHYINNSKAIREAMCFMMDPLVGKKVCYVQFPQRFDGIDRHDRYANRNVVFFDINMKGLDGIQGPIYVGTGCVFRRQALYGYDAPKTKKPPSRTCNCWPKWCCCFWCNNRHKKKTTKSKPEKKKRLFFKKAENQSPAYALGEIEEGTPGVETDKAGIVNQQKLEKKFGSLLFLLHQRFLKMVVPLKSQVLRWALGSVEIFFSKHCPLWYGYGGGLKFLERFSYINSIVYPWTSIPLLAYCTLPAICLLTGKFITPELTNVASLWFMSLFICIFVTGILEMRWSGVAIDDWWRNEQFWVIGAPTTLLLLNFIGVVAGISNAINNGYESWGPLLGSSSLHSG